jgi:hypothetical protein
LIDDQFDSPPLTEQIAKQNKTWAETKKTIKKGTYVMYIALNYGNHSE